jgi:hypothetical protein
MWAIRTSLAGAKKKAECKIKGEEYARKKHIG